MAGRWHKWYGSHVAIHCAIFGSVAVNIFGSPVVVNWSALAIDRIYGLITVCTFVVFVPTAPYFIVR